MGAIIDCNTLFGFWQKDTEDRSLERLLHIMAVSGVDQALTLSGRGVWAEFEEGNRETLQVCARHLQLLPVATIRPTDYYRCREEIAGLRERGFQMIRLFPTTQGWSISHLCFRRLVEAFLAAGLPLAFERPIDEKPEAMARVIEMFAGSDLPLIFSGVSYDLAEFLSACALYPNCYTDTWQLFLLNEMEIIRDEVGIERVLYGSKAPFEMPGAPLEMIRYSRLTEEEKEKVLGGNVLSLGGVGFPVRRSLGEGGSRPADEGGRMGAPCPLARTSPHAAPPSEEGLRVRVIDVHAHYGAWNGLPNPYVSIDDLLETCHRFNIEKCCLSRNIDGWFD